MSGPPFEAAPTEGFEGGRWVIAPRFILNGDTVTWAVWSAPGVLACTTGSLEHARLFCAAPRLLAALKALNAVAVWDDEFTDQAQFMPVAQEADAAIAEAEGRP